LNVGPHAKGAFCKTKLYAGYTKKKPPAEKRAFSGGGRERVEAQQERTLGGESKKPWSSGTKKSEPNFGRTEKRVNIHGGRREK